MNMKSRLNTIQQQIHQAERRAGRKEGCVQLIAVSKQHQVSQLQQAYELGQKCFGESYLQEALEKIDTMADEVEWHFIGRIQSNKTRILAQHFSWIHGIDQLKHAQRLSEQNSQQQAINVCIQVNIDREENKAGILPEKTLDLAGQIKQLSNMSLRGLMALPQAEADDNQRRKSFRGMARLLEQCKQELQIDLDTLSMGMSNDFIIAIEEGATHVRIGSALFGARN